MGIISLMSYETAIDEPVKVWAFFDRGIFPIAMNWQSRLIKFKKLIFFGKRKIGDAKILTFTCASDNGNFELEYNTDNHLWKLKRVMPIG